MPGKCSHEESRLSCVECSAPICTNCMVQCPVGFRCKPCVKPVDRPITKAAPVVVAKLLGLSAGIGFGGGWIMQMIQVPIFGCLIAYFLGIFAGRWLRQFVHYSMGDKISLTVVFGVLIGMSFTPLGLLPMFWAFSIGESLFNGLYTVIVTLFMPVGFTIGVLRAAVWGEYW